jgi:hypothetical protein
VSARKEKSAPFEDGAVREPEPFLTRWSRRKEEARRDVTQTEDPPQPPAQIEEPQHELPPLEKLTLESDFRGFMHPKVSEDLRRAALKKLFSDPHFNVMDGLDVYIEDYSKTEPIPAAMLASLRQAQKILEWAKEDEDRRAAQCEIPAQRPAEALPNDGEVAGEACMPRQADVASEDASPETKA